MGKRLDAAHEFTDLVFKWELMCGTAIAFLSMMVPHYVIDDGLEKVEEWWARRRSPRDAKKRS